MGTSAQPLSVCSSAFCSMASMLRPAGLVGHPVSDVLAPVVVCRRQPGRGTLVRLGAVEIVVPEGGDRATLSVDKLGAVGEPESLTWLKNTTEAMLPRIDLPGPPERAAWPPPLTRRPARRGSRQLQHPDRHQDELEPAWPVDE